MYDSDLGLYYLRARYYNALTGRFMSRDSDEPKLRGSARVPIDPKAFHKYLYAGGDPISARDPTGRSLEEDDELNLQARAEAEELRRLAKSVEFDLCVEREVARLSAEYWDYSDAYILVWAMENCAEEVGE